MNPRTLTSRLASLGFVMALLAPAAAEATTFCVPNGSPGGCDQSFPALQAAVASPLLADGDTIKVAPGQHPGSGDYGIPRRVRIIGAGAGSGGAPFDPATQTRLTAPDGETALHFAAGGELHGVRVAGADGDLINPPATPALELTAAAGTSSGFLANGVVAYGGSFFDGGGAGAEALLATADVGGSMSVSLRHSYMQAGAGVSSNPAVSLGGQDLVAALTEVEVHSAGTGLEVEHDASASLEGSEVTGRPAIDLNDGDLAVSRSRIRGETALPAAGLHVSDTDAARPTTATVVDSLINAAASGAGWAVRVDQAIGNAASASITGSTLVAGGDSPTAAVVVEQTGTPAASVALRNSIALLDGPADSDSADLVAYLGSITASHSSFTSTLTPSGGTAPAPGAATNLSGPPGLVNAAAGDFGLLPTSPLVDRGDPGAVTAGELDLAGNPRSLDGNGDCLAVPDVGAFEITGRAATCPANANVVPVLSRVSMSRRTFAPAPRGRALVARRRRGRKVKRGTRFRYTLSEAATIRIAVERAAKGRRAKGRGRKPTPKNRKGKRCTRHLRVGTLRASETAGKQSTSFTGRFGKRALGPAHYRARLRATDAQGARSKEKRLKFRVLRAR